MGFFSQLLIGTTENNYYWLIQLLAECIVNTFVVSHSLLTAGKASGFYQVSQNHMQQRYDHKASVRITKLSQSHSLGLMVIPVERVGLRGTQSLET